MVSEEWPFGETLRAHREKLKLSLRQAAARTNGMISVGRWHQLEVGYQRVRGHDVPIATRPETIVAASRAVDWNPDEALRLLGYDPDVVPDSQAQTQRRTRQRAKTLADATNADLISELRRRMNSGHNSIRKSNNTGNNSVKKQPP